MTFGICSVCCGLNLGLLIVGHAFSALGRKEDALLVWEKGYEHALCRSADLKQLLELEDLLRVAKQDISTTQEIDLMESSSNMSVSGSAPHISGQSGETYTNHNKSSDESPLCNKLEDKSEALSEATDNLDSCNGFSVKVCENGNFGSEMNGNQDIVDKLSYESDSYSDLSDTSEPGNKLSVICNSSSNATDTHGKLSFKSNICNGISEEVKRKKKFCVARISKAKSISVDFRLSRGIAQVFFMFHLLMTSFL